MPKTYQAIGLMSGTSLDGIDAALVTTDGERILGFGESIGLPYRPDFREQLKLATRLQGDLPGVERQLTLHHAEAVRQLLAKAKLSPGEVDLIGFHGQTVAHRPQEGITWQLGNGALLAAETGIDVIADFRRNDVAHGGQGAPLIPLFHAALCHDLPGATMMVNIGGIANVTFIPADHHEAGIIAFDTGPGNVLIDRWMQQHLGRHCDEGGALAATGQVNADVLAHYLRHPFFSLPAPKSLDRHDFGLEEAEGLPVEDGAATLTALTVQSLARALALVPEVPQRWLIGGGGRLNHTLLRQLQQAVNAEVSPVEARGWDGDMFEAQAFGFLAVRSLLGLHLTTRCTTGVRYPVTGGALYRSHH